MKRAKYRRNERRGKGFFLLLSFLFLCIFAKAQQTPQSPSPMTETTRPHERISQVDVPGRRIELKSLPGATLYVGPDFKAGKAAPLVVHFHGLPWLVQYHVAHHLPRAALITVQLGSGSSAYNRPFDRTTTFQAMLDEAKQSLGIKREWSSITLVGFSAGYGAVRAILREDKNFARVNNVLLLDGIHASYSPEGKTLADGGAVNSADLDSFEKFAREAVNGRKSFVITHSEIFPGTYASTTECVDFLLSQLNLHRKPQLLPGPMGMQQLSAVDAKGFHIRGYAGNTAPDHVDQLQAMPSWFKLLGLK